ncbi:MAG: DNA repair protein RecN [Proteobacteria bacterium]|nr:DNA repair protein RecN [Pseudomonadota bacterium]MBU1716303.1 DNA repair protein RecN [Pseudomonadota bacterium]
MLRELRITNLALVESLQIDFTDGLIVLTGETGAGKSIIMQSMYLLTGGRAAVSWVRTGAEAATVEALFDCHAKPMVLEKIRAGGFETDGEVIIKRIISIKGKSSFYVNGSMATVKSVTEMAEYLLSVASQHDHQQLLVPRYHLDFIDAVGNLWGQREGFTAIYREWRQLRDDLQILRQKENDKEQHRDFLDFQCREIEEASLRDGEDEELDQEKDRLKAADDLIRLGHQTFEMLSGDVTDALAIARKNLEQMASFDQGITELASQVAGLSFQLEESVAQVRDYVDNVVDDPERLDLVIARIDLLQRLKRKYGPTLADVVAHGEKTREELKSLAEMDQRLEDLQRKVADCEQKLLVQARIISEARKKTSEKLVADISAELKALCFDHAIFEIYYDGPENPAIADISSLGWDRPEFMFSANPGEPVKPVAKIASGGELSRLMLALKCILARHDQVETVIFDEVDAGISGKAAEAVARKIRELAGHHQVLCITHLPQIAAGADEHYLVEKNVINNRTRTTISHLSKDTRVGELARMLDGESITDQTMAYARELVSRNI